MNNTKTEQMPALVELLKAYDNELSCLDGLTCEIKSKCNQLYRLEEPENPSNKEALSEKANDVVGEFRIMVGKLQKYNQRLKEIHVHLNRICN